MNKRGFTLIEIIICIALLAVVGAGTTVTIVSVNNKKESNILLEQSENFETALNIYLSNHSEILSNLYDSVEGAVVTLELLKNEGLIDDGLDIDYHDNYFLISDAVLLSDSTNVESECNGRVSIETIKSWDLSKYDSSKVLYICPKNENDLDNNIEKNVISNGYVASGYEANNWVVFDVTPEKNEWVYFPNDEEEDLWRIVVISQQGQIKLIYNKGISVNNQKNINYNMSKCNTSSQCKLNEDSPYHVCSDSYYWKIIEDNQLSLSGIFEDASTNTWSPKYYIYDAIVNRDFIQKTSYKSNITYPSLSGINASGIFDVRYTMQQTSASYEDYIGNLSLLEIRNSFDNNDSTYIPNTMFAYNSDGSNDKYDRMAKLNVLENGEYSSISYTSQSYVCGSDYTESFYTYYYSPVVTLNSNVKIKDYSNCSDGSIRGSKNCPFELVKS